MRLSRRPLSCTVGIALASGLWCGSGIHAAPIVQLGALDGSNGFRLDGEVLGDASGAAVAGAGDVNGDGLNDLLIGAYRAESNGTDSGRSYLVFGSNAGFPTDIDLGTLDGGNGFRLDGETGDESGVSIDGVGDLNGDGIDDLVIGAPYADPVAPDSGSSYVVFGRDDGFAAELELGALDGNDGFRLDGVSADEASGHSVAGAGDINGDGIADLVIGAPYAAPNGARSGRSYVVFGSAEGFSASLDLGALDGSNGFRAEGQADEYSGYAVAGAGDINGDGIDDLVIGAFRADTQTTLDSGSSYVIFGSDAGFAASFALDSLDGDNGFRINGAASHDFSGHSVSAAGDVNGDGIDDLLIGAPSAEPNGSDSGSSYVVFGRIAGFTAVLDLGDLDGGNGFRMDGAAAQDFSGQSLAAAGDINGDGIDDVLVSSHAADSNGPSSGSSHVVFGSAAGFPAALELGALDGSNGVRLDGVADNDHSGYRVAETGDVNGDGIDDLVIGAPAADPNGETSGSSYVVFGNAAPQSDGLPAEIAAILEDAANPVGSPVNSVILAHYIDSDPLAGIGITLDAPASADGAWQFLGGDDWENVPTSGLSVHSGLVLDSGARLRFVAAADFNGPASPLSVRFWDGVDAAYPSGVVSDIHGSIGSIGGFANDANLLEIGAFVLPVNDAPAFSAPALAPIPFDAGKQTVPNWAAFDPGPDNESAQIATWIVSDISDPALFAVAPSVDDYGTLRFTPASGAVGSSQFTLRVVDSGGIANGGIDTSAPQTFTVEILVGADRVFCDGFDGVICAG